jgi:hypothetical protein
MVKFTIEKKSLEAATGILNVVANLKSVGAIPSESSGITLTPSTITLSNTNEANAVFIENITLAVKDGEVGSHLDATYMVNTKKFDSIVRGSGKDVMFTILEDKIVVGEGKRIFELAIYKTQRKTVPETIPLGHTVQLDKVLLNMAYTDYITQNIVNRGDLAGTLFSEGGMLASDKVSALQIKNSGLFASADHPDMIITTDLFAACASKIKQPTAMPAFTLDGKRFALLFDNITLCKSVRTEQFPKEGIRKSIARSQEAAAGQAPCVTALVSVVDFANKLKEIRSIVEADDYIIEYQSTGQLLIKNANSQQGTGGEELVDAEIKFNNIVTNSLAAKFSFTHLELIGRLFAKQDKILLLSRIDNVTKKPILASMAIMGDDHSYVFIPKASV